MLAVNVAHSPPPGLILLKNYDLFNLSPTIFGNVK
jgi:hypothetical protein